MKYRMGVAVLSLLGILVSAYLYLYKIGAIGTLACGAGGCETVQSSPWSRFLGIEVALYGVVGYLGLLVVSLVGLQPRQEARRWPDDLVALMSGVGVGFSLYLTYLELFVIEAICRWCVVSAVLIGAIFVLALLARRHRHPGRVAREAVQEP
ncbi:MAG TPA: vitamin K epoxide reductase family protein [Gemmatimonadales bacterium]|nr:vitamin K epoxide reductase family protein [Gemmatimonadales bacterium]